ncbi:MAG: hypothetical protein NT077_01385 [Candidatus Taylorbacteria bacterium]|nr:hypothetical protein [Candidatus Taylorbacteria bacterium]
MKKNNIYIFFAVTGTVVVLWQLLASGYVLTLDMIFGPHVDLVHNAGDLWNTAPIWYMLAFVTSILGGWITQKILLIVIFFLLFYLPLHFFKKIFSLENTHGAEYVASLVFAINPFVYERFLAGQWNVLCGYVLLVPLTAYLMGFCREWNYKNGLKLLGIIILTGAISTHVFIMSLIVIGVALIVNLISHAVATKKLETGFLKSVLLLGLSVLVLSSYWLIPAIVSKATPITNFGPENWGAFRTAGSDTVGTLSNVLSLHGFWGEHEVWVTRFLLPKDNGWLYGVAFVLFAAIILVGIYAGFTDKRFRNMTIFSIAIMCLAVVFSCGVGAGIFQNFNIWMFEHLSFWKGFRDTEKWSAIVAVSYALFAGLGSIKILSYFENANQSLWFTKYKRSIFYVLLAIPLLYTPMMLFGFAGQLKTTQYPNSWAEVNNVLKQDKSCHALFLPWHGYYNLKFNNDILTANIARNYFDCDIIQGRNMELGTISSQGGNGEEYSSVEKMVTDNNANPDATIDLLKQKGIKFIIFTTDIQFEDPYKYPFLGSSLLQEVIHRGDVYLYRIF